MASQFFNQSEQLIQMLMANQRVEQGELEVCPALIHRLADDHLVMMEQLSSYLFVLLAASLQAEHHAGKLGLDGQLEPIMS